MKIVGFGFRPTEVELVDFYLKLKLLDDPRAHVMTEIDLCNVAPWEVPGNNLKLSMDFDQINAVLFLALIFTSILSDSFIVSISDVSEISNTIQ